MSRSERWLSRSGLTVLSLRVASRADRPRDGRCVARSLLRCQQTGRRCRAACTLRRDAVSTRTRNACPTCGIHDWYLGGTRSCPCGQDRPPHWHLSSSAPMVARIAGSCARAATYADGFLRSPLSWCGLTRRAASLFLTGLSSSTYLHAQWCRMTPASVDPKQTIQVPRAHSRSGDRLCSIPCWSRSNVRTSTT